MTTYCFLQPSTSQCVSRCAAYMDGQTPQCALVHAAVSLSRYLDSHIRKNDGAVKHPAGAPAPEVT